MTGMLPSFDQLHESLFDREAPRERFEKALLEAVAHCRLRRHWRIDDITPALRLGAGQ